MSFYICGCDFFYLLIEVDIFENEIDFKFVEWVDKVVKEGEEIL